MKNTVIRILSLVLLGALSLGLSALTSCRRLPDAVETPGADTVPIPKYDFDLTEYVTVGQYRGIAAPAGTVTVTDDSVEKVLREIANRYAEKTPVTDRGVQAGDLIAVSYTVSCEGADTALLNSLAGVDVSFYVGSDDAPYAGFNSALLGARCDAPVDFVLTMPADFAVTTLRGKACRFSVTVTAIAEAVPPTLDDAFAAARGYDDLAAMRRSVRDELLADAAEQNRADLEAFVWNAVLEGSAVLRYPEDAVTYYYDKMYTLYTEYADATGVSLETLLADSYGTDPAAFRTQCLDYARAIVKEQLVIYTIVRAENISLTDEDYQNGISRYMGKYRCTESELRASFTDEELRQSILWDKVRDYLADEAIVG